MSNEVLRRTGHRPWPLPDGPWVMAQTWHDLLFAHWPVPPASLERLIPPQLALDTFEGAAWIGVVPFRMTGIRFRGLPPLPGLSAFAEINVRTYVTAVGKPGVWFFSLDAGNRLAVAAARRWYRLPYFHARFTIETQRDGIRYTCRRSHRGAPAAEFDSRYAPVGDAALTRTGSLAHWLTERYCLYAVDRRRRLYCAEIHHPPWPLQPAHATIEQNTMATAAGVALPSTPPHLHFAGRLDVRVWPPQRVGIA